MLCTIRRHDAYIQRHGFFHMGPNCVSHYSSAAKYPVAEGTTQATTDAVLTGGPYTGACWW